MVNPAIKTGDRTGLVLPTQEFILIVLSISSVITQVDSLHISQSHLDAFIRVAVFYRKTAAPLKVSR
jgi:hypothetical protein